MNFWQVDIDGDLLSPGSGDWYFWVSASGGPIDEIDEIHIDWGDGTTTTSAIPTNNNISHTYTSTAGNRKHSIKITSHNLRSLLFRRTGSSTTSYEAAVTKVYPLGGVPNLTSFTMDNSSITELPEGLLENSIDTLHTVSLKNNKELTELPADLLKDFGKQQYIDTGIGVLGTAMFSGSAIKSIPIGLLQQSYIYRLERIFEGTDIEEVPADVFIGLPMSRDENLGRRPTNYQDAFKNSQVREVVGAGPMFDSFRGPDYNSVFYVSGIFNGSQLERVPRQILDGLWNYIQSGNPRLMIPDMFRNTPIDAAPPFWLINPGNYTRISNMYAGTQATISEDNYNYMPSNAGGGGQSTAGHILPTVNWVKTEGNKVTGVVTDNGTTDVLWRGVVVSRSTNPASAVLDSYETTHYSDYDDGLGEFTVKVPIGFAYYRVFAASVSGVSYSNVITPPTNPGKMLEFF